MNTATATSPTSRTKLALRRLYWARFGFAVAWAALFAATSSPVASFAVGLLVLYPAFDVIAAVVDTRTSGDSRRSRAGLYLNVALSGVAAVTLAVVGDDMEGILLTWGAWAIAAGAVQLAVGVTRRSLGGQLPMMLSGGISVLAGASFAASAQDADSVTQIAGYAVLGGIFFLISAVRLGRVTSPLSED